MLAEAGLLVEGASRCTTRPTSLMHHLLAGLRPPPVPQGPALRGAKRRSRHRGRIHRPPDGGPPLVGWPAPGRGSQRRREDQAENQTLASVTFQNYFRLYGKLAGMTGTADTEAYEFQEIYGLETVVIPPNRILAGDQLDLVYKTARKSTTPSWPTSRNAMARPAGAGGHHQHRKLGTGRPSCCKRRFAAPGAERQAARP